uniref:CFA20 domain-containing protein n=1 Tax=Spongospora subterranea TaxID=70186 RepID=A0A0H5QJ73_9EUKA|eukprot:CRZ02160.1 hypothetical protein [Spongospora subterranea]
MSSLTVACFQNDFRSLEGIILRPNCSIRKIFTLRCPPSDIEIAVSEQHNSPYSIFAPIPKTVDFPSGVSHVTQILNWDVVAPAAPTPRKKIVIARPPLRSPNMKSVIKRSRRLSEAHSLSREGTGLALTTRSKSKTPSKPIARRRLTISPNINRVLPPTRTQRAVRSSEMPLFHQKSSSLQTSSEECIRKIAPCAKIEEEDENVPPPSQEFNIQKPASTDAVSNASQLDCLETQVGVKEIWERQNDREIENREETDMDGDTDLDLVLMGELSEEGALNREEAVANTCKPDINDWNTDEDELDFVQDALKYYDAESRRTASLSRSSSARASVESGKSFLEPNEVCASTESAFNVLRQQLRPVRLSRNGKARSESSSRCSSTSTSSARAAMAATLPLSETHENRSVKQQFMFDPILKLYFDPSTNKYFEMR